MPMPEMKITVARTSATDFATPLLVLQFFEREFTKLPPKLALVDERLKGLLHEVWARGDFHGRKDETLLLFPRGSMPAERILLVGLGKAADYTVERLRRGVGTAVRQAERMNIQSIALTLDHVDRLSERMGSMFSARGAIEAAVLATWDMREFKTVPDDSPAPKPVEEIVLLAGDEDEERDFNAAAKYAFVAARSANFARDLACRPGNVVTPTYLAGVAEGIASDFGLKVTILDRAAMREEGMHALLAVAQGSMEEPRFIALEYMKGPPGAAPLVIIGKGVTFDSGGISIKPAERMEDMKYDMSGAAATLAAMRGIAELNLPVNVVGLVPTTENLPSGTAYKPGDVIKSHLGKTIEIVNTDAEGRLILADALSYAQRYKPAAMVNAATLTGAVVVALGQQAIGLMGNDGDLMDEIQAAGQRTGERCWKLPLWDEYRELIDSTIADMKNSGGRQAGTITAGWFLKEFAGTTPWVHLDIAGTAYRDDAPPYLRKGPTGVPTRLFIEWVRGRAEA